MASPQKLFQIECGREQAFPYPKNKAVRLKSKQHSHTFFVEVTLSVTAV